MDEINRTATEARRILIAVTGLSPQVVTETVFALAMQKPRPWIPDEIVVITTSRGARNVGLELLSDKPGWFHRLRLEWSLPEIAFNEASIRILRRPDGSALDDIRDDQDNLCVADGIAAIVREYAGQSNTEIHASIAGGRKTMGFCLGYAMSLFGRAQDRLSHVLVSAPYESNPDFYYPSSNSRLIRSYTNGVREIDASHARVWLGDIPFVRLSEGLPPGLLRGTASFADAVSVAQRGLMPRSLDIHLDTHRVICGGTSIDLPPVQLAFMAWFARRKQSGAPALLKPKTAGHAEAKEFLVEYRRVVPLIRETGFTADRLSGGMDKTFFEETNSKLKRSITGALGARGALPYLIVGVGRPKHYELLLPGHCIRFLEETHVAMGRNP